MEKIPPPAKNDMFDERLAIVEAKVNEIVEFVNGVSATAIDADPELDEQEPNGD